MNTYTVGLDFGTESVRSSIVDIQSGDVAGQATCDYQHGVIDRVLPTSGAPLPPDYALQHPQDWLDSVAAAVRAAMRPGDLSASQVVGIGIAFTSCTMLPCMGNGTPLCLLPRFANVPLAWPKLWKHHGAKRQTDRINCIARERNEPWLSRYGGLIGLEWFFPKILETLDEAPDVYAAAEVWLEAGDWLVWQLTGGPFPHCQTADLVRSTCQAGYKAMWSAQSGFPSRDFFAALDARLADVKDKLPGTHRAPGACAGKLTPKMAQNLGLPQGIAVSAAIIDAHAGVPGAGVAEPDTLVMVLGTSSCHMLNSRVERPAPGIAGIVRDGILPGYVGYETGQASVGDAFAWLTGLTGQTHEALTIAAEPLGPGAGGVLAVDWLNGCRTPLMDGELSGAFFGLTLGTGSHQLYRALIEATAFGLLWIVQTLREAGVPVGRFVAAGGLPQKSPLLMRIYADVLNEPIRVAHSEQSVARGAAILGCLAAGAELTGHTEMHGAIRAMAPQHGGTTYRPTPDGARKYQALYALYRELAKGDGAVAEASRRLRAVAHT